MAQPTPNQSWTIFDVPQEIREMIWAAILENSQTWVGRITVQPHGETAIRRFISDQRPDSLPRILDFPPHPLEYVHSQIANEFRSRWHWNYNPSLTIGQMQLVPAGMFNGILHLCIGMRQAMYTLQVAIPSTPAPYNSNPPNTFLTLTNAPQLQNLDIFWPIEYGNTDFGIHQTVFEFGLARLQYFRRSFRAVIHFAARRDGITYCSGTLLDAAGPITNHVPGIADNYNSNGLDPTDDYTNLRNSLRYVTQNLLNGPNANSPLNGYSAITEAQVWYDYVPLGYVRGVHDDRLPQVIAPLRLTPRPYDP